MIISTSVFDSDNPTNRDAPILAIFVASSHYIMKYFISIKNVKERKRERERDVLRTTKEKKQIEEGREKVRGKTGTAVPCTN